MGTLYLDRKDLAIRAERGALLLYEAGERTGTVPLALLSQVVVHGQAEFTSTVLTALDEANVGLVVLAVRDVRRTAILPGRGHADVARRLAQYQWFLDRTRREQFRGR